MTTALRTRPNALSLLLAHYIAGDITEGQMTTLDTMFEDADADASERLAFARFYLDAMEAGEARHAMPKVAEVAGILSSARA